MIGEKIGRLTVIASAPKREGSRSLRWLCLCDCGAETSVDAGNLRKKTTKSCGCARRERGEVKFTKHGVRFHPAYLRWVAMRNRCYSPTNRAYRNYGGRGIFVCAEWIDDPVAFVAWADASGFDPSLQLDRRDNDSGYSPQNCRWVTRSENNRNRRPRNRGGL